MTQCLVPACCCPLVFAFVRYILFPDQYKEASFSDLVFLPAVAHGFFCLLLFGKPVFSAYLLLTIFLFV